MQESTYEIAYEFTKNNFDNVSKVIPIKLIKKEEKLLSTYTKSKSSPLQKLSSLFGFMNEIYSHVQQLTPCKKGCNSCCHYNINISELEASLITQVTNREALKPNKPTIKTDFHGSPCPFLSDGTCSIYEVRPFVCRRYVSLSDTSKWCNTDVANDYEFPILNFTEVDKSYNYILSQSPLHAVQDIRQFFK